jgi:hypothetical protein
MKLNGNKSQVQQGDVILEKINYIPDGLTKREKHLRGFVLAEGEAHGHAHRFKENVELYDYYDDELKEKCILLKVLEDNQPLKHEEHETIFFNKGIYRVNIVREFDPFEEEIRKVMD